MNFTIGADPEVFVGDDVSVRSVIGKIGGSKHMPRPLVKLGPGFAVQEDNVAMEFNIPACSTKAQFVSSINKATGYLSGLIRETHGLRFDKRSAVSFPETEFYDPAAYEFGCEPDYNAWTRRANPRPKAKDKNLRSCGGHIHIGFNDVDPHEVVKACDLFLSVPAQMMDNGELRKQLYGKAGAFRMTEYGVEYRSLSNFWIFDSRLIEWAYDNTERALDAVRAGMSFDEEKNSILEAVDNGDKDIANLLIVKYNLEVAERA
jgi:hypothetical protein